MKKTLKIVMLALLACTMLACGEKKIKQEDLEKTELSVSNDNGNLNKEAVPAAIEQFCTFVKQSPDDPTAPDWLFKAMQFATKAGDTDKAIELTDQLVKDYPTYRNAPTALVMLASEVYDSQLHDLDKARTTYERVIREYPGSDWAESAAKLIEFLGMTPEEIMNQIILSQKEEAEEKP